MADFDHIFGSDLVRDGTGDFETVTGIEFGRQRVLRRLLTTPGEYIFHPDYGAGLAAFIGQTPPAARIKAVVRSQMFLEAAVQRDPPPTIDVTPNPDGTFLIDITYTDAGTSTPVFLQVPIS